MSQYSISVSTEGILKWTINIKDTDYIILQKFIDEINLCKFTNISSDNKWICGRSTKTADFKSINTFKLVSTKLGKEYFDTIKNFLCSRECSEEYPKEDNNRYLEIGVDNSYQRIIIYMICIIFGLRCSKVRKIIDVIVPCTIYLPCNKGKPREEHKISCCNSRNELECGCDYAPKSFHKHHYDNNYDDTISYSKFRSKMNVAIRIYDK